MSGDESSFLVVTFVTLRTWEQGRREPFGPAKALLRAIHNGPEHVLKALAARHRGGGCAPGRPPRLTPNESAPTITAGALCRARKLPKGLPLRHMHQTQLRLLGTGGRPCGPFHHHRR